MATPSTDTEKSRDLRDSRLVRAAVLVAVLAVAFLYVRGASPQSRPVTPEHAVEIARAEVAFTPDRYQVRFIQQGIPARGYWAVSLLRRRARTAFPTEVEVFLVDAKTGDVRPA